MADFPRGLPN